MHETTSIEQAFLVGIELKKKSTLWHVQDSLNELAALADTAGVKVVGRVWQKLSRIHSATLIGPGKLNEIVEQRRDLQFNTVIFDDELSPRQIREIEEAFGENSEIKILDRTALILDIFAKHAHSREGALQVELAQLQYRLPRLTRAWTHLARQSGGRAGGATGGVGLRGPGETQLEMDRRVIRSRISFLKGKLDQVRQQRQRRRSKRKREGLPVAALVGYTNAGKSTLLNSLTDADVLAADMLFATLDPTTRRVELPSHHTILATDTVGFIQKLPHQLVASFRATLEEVQDAELLVHVVDTTHPNVTEQIVAVEDTLREIGAGDKPMLYAFNKTDQLDENGLLVDLLESYPDSLPISALTGKGLGALLDCIEEKLYMSMDLISITIPYARGDLVDLFHRRGIIEVENHNGQGTHIKGRLPAYLTPQFEQLY